MNHAGVTDPEHRRQLAYIEAQLASPREDTGHLTYRRREILRRYRLELRSPQLPAVVPAVVRVASEDGEPTRTKDTYVFDPEQSQVRAA